MICFLKYLAEVARNTVIIRDNEELKHRFDRSDYIASLEELKRQLVAKCKPLRNLAQDETRAKREREELAAPGTTEHRNQAYTRYYLSPHFQEKCKLLAKWALPNQENEISEIEFNYLARWIMWNTIMCDGKRPQNAVLFKNKHFLERIRGSVSDIERENQEIHFNRDVFLERDNVHCYSIGRADISERGKTGPTDLMLPYSLAVAMECYHEIKCRLFKEKADSGDGPFFISFKGGQLKMDGIEKSTVIKEICKLMGVKSLTPNNNRHGMATRMVEAGAEGDTGMEHTSDTQKKTYDDRGRAQGVMNKRKANAKIMEAEQEQDLYNPELSQLLQGKRKKDAEKASDKRRQQVMDVVLKKDVGGTRNRGGKKFILSEEKMRYISSIWSCLSIEFTAYVFCSADFPTVCLTHEAFLTRYLFTSTEGMNQIREDVANICTRWPDAADDTLVKLFLKVMKSSITAFNRTRQDRDPPQHVLLNFRSIERRYENENARLEQVREKYTIDKSKKEDTAAVIRSSIAEAVKATFGGKDIQSKEDTATVIRSAIAEAVTTVNPPSKQPPASQAENPGGEGSSSGYHNPTLAATVQSKGMVMREQERFADSSDEDTFTTVTSKHPNLSAAASSTAEVSKSGLKRKLVYSVQEARRILRDQYRFPYNSDDDEQDDRPTPKNQPSEEIEFADDTEVKRRRITRANPRTNRPPSPPASPVSSDYDIGGVSDDSVKDQDYVAENDSEKETDEDTEMEDPLQTEDEETS